MSTLTLALLGPFESSLMGQSLVRFRTSRVQALLAYLSTEFALGTPRQPREVLMELLWPGMPPNSARTNLRQNLYYLRQTIPDLPASEGEETIPFLLADRQAIALNPAYPMDLDVARFEELLASSEDEWPEAIVLYRGDFLGDFYLSDSSPFEEWAVTRRSAFRRQMLEALGSLAKSAVKQDQLKKAEQYSRRQLEIDPLGEGAYRTLMRVLTWSGRQGEALALYEECVRLLERELGSSPSEATMTLADTIREGNLEAPAEAIMAEQVEADRRRSEALDQYETPADEILKSEQTQLTGQVPPPPSPYRGLFAFREQDAAFFFGREAISERLLMAVRKQPLLAIIGPSGSGKSSLAAAGLVAGLRPDKNWRFAIFRPGSYPFQALAASLVPLLDPDLSETERLVEAGKLAGALREEVLSLEDVLERILQLAEPDGRLLFLGNQFEELYTLCPDVDLRQRFLSALLTVVNKQTFRPQPAVSIALTLRADFMEQALAYRPLADALQGATFILGPMTREELALAIEKPAEVQAVEFEAGLVERILDDVGSEPGNLPLLEFALTELWAEQSGWLLTHEAYKAIGRVEGALARYADEVYEALSEDEQRAARRVFVQMVRPGERVEDTRRLARRQEIGDKDWALAQRLADTRLVVTGRDAAGQETAELVHETLIWRWGRLGSWLEEDRAFRFWQERLRAALEAWLASDGDEGALLRGRPLAEAEDWLNEWADRLSPIEKNFIKASQELRDQQQRKREEAQAAQERTRRRIALGLAFGLVLALILSAVAGWGWLQANQTQQELAAERDLTTEALVKLLASQSELLLEKAPDLALLLSVEATTIDPSVEARGSLLSAISHNPQLESFLHGHNDAVRSVAYSPDGKLLASGGVDGTILLWDLSASGGKNSAISLEGHTDRVTGLAFSPDGRTLASAGFDDTVRLWNVMTGEASAPPLTGQGDNIWSLAFSPDGQTLASAGADGRVLFWNAVPGSASFGQSIAPPLQVHEGIVSALSFNPESGILATGDSGGSVVLWDVSGLPEGDGAEIEALNLSSSGHEARVGSLAFSPDGKILASGSNDGDIILWDSDLASPSFGQVLGQEIVASKDWITSLTFRPDGSTLAAAGRDGWLTLWNIKNLATSGQPVKEMTINGHRGEAWSLAFSPDGQTLASGGGDGKVALWRPEPAHPLARSLTGPRLLPDSAPGIRGLEFSPDGSLLASGGADGSLVFWDPVSGQPLLPPIEADQSGLYGVTFSSDGTMLATGGNEDVLRLWQADVGSADFGKQIGPAIEANQSDINELAFNPQEPLLASAGNDQTVILWDMDRESPTFGQPVTEPLTGHTSPVWNLVFDPSGSKLASSEDFGGRTTLVWDLESDPPVGEQLGALTSPEERFLAVLDFSPIEPLLAVGGAGELSFWDTSHESPAMWAPIGPIIPIDQMRTVFAVFEADFSPDGKLLAAGDDHRLLLVDVASQQLIGPALELHPNPLRRLTFSPDGSRVAAGGDQGSITLWTVDLESWIEIACSLVNRNFSQEEWSQYFGRETYRETCPGLPAG